MFDQLKAMKELGGLMKDLPKMKARMEEVKARLEATEVEAETGGGAVRAKVTAAMKVVSIDIDPAMMGALVDPSSESDRGLAADLVTGAVNAALTKARAAAEAEIQRAASEFNLPIPAGTLSGLMS